MSNLASNTHYLRDWTELERLWKPLLSDADWRLLCRLAMAFDDEWLSRHSKLLQVHGHCHHVYRWLIVPWAARPWRLLELAEGVETIATAITRGRLRDVLVPLPRHLVGYSPDDHFAFFTHEFEVVTIGRLLRRESDRLSVENLEVGSGKRNDVLLRIDGKRVYIELKTLQRPQEERDLSLANDALLRLMRSRVSLSTGCEIRLATIPDEDEREEIVQALIALEEHRVAEPREVEAAAAIIRYGFTSSGLGLSYASSRVSAIRRIRRMLKSVAAKASGIRDARVLLLRLYHFDRQDAQFTALLDALSDQEHANLAAVVLLQSAPM